MHCDGRSSIKFTARKYLAMLLLPGSMTVV
jgi:hypothetical protein